MIGHALTWTNGFVLGCDVVSVEADVSNVPVVPAEVDTWILTEDGDPLDGGVPGGVCGEQARVQGGGGVGDEMFLAVLAVCVVGENVENTFSRYIDGKPMKWDTSQ